MHGRAASSRFGGCPDVAGLIGTLRFDRQDLMIPEGETKMNPTRWPAWALTLLGVVAIVAGALGVTHAPPAIGKVTWGVVIVFGVIAIILAVRRRLATSRR